MFKALYESSNLFSFHERLLDTHQVYSTLILKEIIQIKFSELVFFSNEFVK